MPPENQFYDPRSTSMTLPLTGDPDRDVVARAMAAHYQTALESQKEAAMNKALGQKALYEQYTQEADAPFEPTLGQGLAAGLVAALPALTGALVGGKEGIAASAEPAAAASGTYVKLLADAHGKKVANAMTLAKQAAEQQQTYMKVYEDLGKLPFDFMQKATLQAMKPQTQNWFTALSPEQQAQAAQNRIDPGRGSDKDPFSDEQVEDIINNPQFAPAFADLSYPEEKRLRVRMYGNLDDWNKYLASQGKVWSNTNAAQRNVINAGKLTTEDTIESRITYLESRGNTEAAGRLRANLAEAAGDPVKLQQLGNTAKIEFDQATQGFKNDISRNYADSVLTRTALATTLTQAKLAQEQGRYQAPGLIPIPDDSGVVNTDPARATKAIAASQALDVINTNMDTLEVTLGNTGGKLVAGGEWGERQASAIAAIVDAMRILKEQGANFTNMERELNISIMGLLAPEQIAPGENYVRAFKDRFFSEVAGNRLQVTPEGLAQYRAYINNDAYARMMHNGYIRPLTPKDKQFIDTITKNPKLYELLGPFSVIKQAKGIAKGNKELENDVLSLLGAGEAAKDAAGNLIIKKRQGTVQAMAEKMKEIEAEILNSLKNRQPQ
jgi:hypothetical protein